MKIAVQKLNEGITIDRQALENTATKYCILLSRANNTLYDLGYQKSPTIFNKKEFIRSLLQEFPDEMEYLKSNLDGSLTLTPLMIKYAICRTQDKNFKSLMGYLYDIVFAKEAMESISVVWNKVNLKKKSTTVVKPRLSVSNNIKCHGVLPIDNPAVQECIARVDGTYLSKCDTRYVLVKTLCSEVGITADEYLKHKSTGKAFFIDDLSATQELDFIKYLISGVIKPDGIFGTKLEDYISCYYDKMFTEINERYSCIKVEEMLFVKSLPERLAVTDEFRHNLSKLGGREFYVTEDFLIFEVPDVLQAKKKTLLQDKLFTGSYVLDWVTKEQLSKLNNLRGFSGEFIKKSDLEEMGYIYNCKSVKLQSLVRSGSKLCIEETEYYPINSVFQNQEDLEDEKHLEPLIGDKLQLVFSELDILQRNFGVHDKKSFFRYIKSLVDTSFSMKKIEVRKSVVKDGSVKQVKSTTTDVNIRCGNEIYSKLVAELVLALVYMECGYSEYEFSFGDYSFVDNDLFIKASYDAEEVFKLLNI